MKFSLLFIAPLLAISSIAPNKDVGSDTYSLSGQGDRFSLIEDNFDKEDKFTFSSHVSFASGQATGLVFGAKENDHYWVFNIDRVENRTKLLYFSLEEGETKANVLEDEYYIGNDKTAESEFHMINLRLPYNQTFDLKVVITPEEGHTYAEFYVDNIRRFGVDNVIDLDAYEDISYEGGNIGYNVFNADVSFANNYVTENDVIYYSELYRNQFHYTQYSHWNNDPNGLVYYNGYYHMYYQTNPFEQQWGDMYWGHARSRDLLHWEELPLALFPDDGNMGFGLGYGYAWSGSAMVYHSGMSNKIDELNWFPSGEGLLAYYTRDGMKQDQVIIISNDEGMTWERKHLISQDIIESNGKIDCRDPSIFPVKKSGEKVTLWGMTLAGQGRNKVWFLKSTDLVNWSYAGEFNSHAPECVTVSKVYDTNNVARSLITITSRGYIIGDFSFDSLTSRIIFKDQNNVDISTYTMVELETMDYSEDSYASQVFYIDDETSDYYNCSVGVSWFSGVPNDAEANLYASVRKPWNGGFTIPVKYGLSEKNGKQVLTQTPITKDNANLEKTTLKDINNQSISKESAPTLLNDVDSHLLEIYLDIQNTNNESIEFKVDLSEDEYTAFGWNKEDGYYVDRRNTSDAGISFAKTYHSLYKTGSVDLENQTFYVLVDNGGIEVFCGNFKYAFYTLTLANPYSTSASLSVSGDVTLNSLKVNEISSVWKNKDSNVGVIYLDRQNIELDLTLLEKINVVAYSTSSKTLTWKSSDEEIVKVTPTAKGAILTAHGIGNAIVTVDNETDMKSISVVVDNGEIDSNIEFNKDGIYSGNWLTTSNGLKGIQLGGDGFILSKDKYTNFTYTATIDLTNAVAGGLLFRAKDDMSSYFMANYDKGAKITKLWNEKRELGSAHIEVSNLSAVNITVFAVSKNIKVAINGNTLIDVVINDDEAMEGKLGLNVCAGSALFKGINTIKDEYDFNNEDLVIYSPATQFITSLVNVSKNNQNVVRGNYEVDGNKLIISKSYFLTLESNTLYKFMAYGSIANFEFSVNTGEIKREGDVIEATITEGQNFNIYVGNIAIDKVTLDGATLTSDDYFISGTVLVIKAKVLKAGTHQIIINDKYVINLNTKPVSTDVVTDVVDRQLPVYVPILITLGSIALATGLAFGVYFVVIALRKKKYTWKK